MPHGNITSLHTLSLSARCAWGCWALLVAIWSRVVLGSVRLAMLRRLPLLTANPVRANIPGSPRPFLPDHRSPPGGPQRHSFVLHRTATTLPGRVNLRDPLARPEHFQRISACPRRALAHVAAPKSSRPARWLTDPAARRAAEAFVRVTPHCNNTSWPNESPRPQGAPRTFSAALRLSPSSFCPRRRFRKCSSCSLTHGSRPPGAPQRRSFVLHRPATTLPGRMNLRGPKVRPEHFQQLSACPRRALAHFACSESARPAPWLTDRGRPARRRGVRSCHAAPEQDLPDAWIAASPSRALKTFSGLPLVRVELLPAWPFPKVLVLLADSPIAAAPGPAWKPSFVSRRTGTKPPGCLNRRQPFARPERLSADFHLSASSSCPRRLFRKCSSCSLTHRSRPPRAPHGNLRSCQAAREQNLPAAWIAASPSRALKDFQQTSACPRRALAHFAFSESARPAPWLTDRGRPARRRPSRLSFLPMPLYRMAAFRRVLSPHQPGVSTPCPLTAFVCPCEPLRDCTPENEFPTAWPASPRCAGHRAFCQSWRPSATWGRWRCDHRAWRTAPALLMRCGISMRRIVFLGTALLCWSWSRLIPPPRGVGR